MSITCLSLNGTICTFLAKLLVVRNERSKFVMLNPTMMLPGVFVRASLNFFQNCSRSILSSSSMMTVRTPSCLNPIATMRESMGLSILNFSSSGSVSYFSMSNGTVSISRMMWFIEVVENGRI